MGRCRRRRGRPSSRPGDLSGASSPLPVPGSGAARAADRWRNLDARGTRQRGSVLLLVPAGVLVLIILGAISVDFAIAFSRQRELSSLAAAVANDAATAALSDERFYRGSATDAEGPAGGSDLEIDPVAARRLGAGGCRPAGPARDQQHLRRRAHGGTPGVREDPGRRRVRVLPGAARSGRRDHSGGQCRGHRGGGGGRYGGKGQLHLLIWATSCGGCSLVLFHVE